jgi:hypothetical protein
LRKKVFVLLLIMLTLFLSCTRTLTLAHVETYSKRTAELNYLGRNRQSYIKLISKEIFPARKINLQGGWLHYIQADSDTVRKISADKIRYIYFKDHFLGIFDGMICGLLGGAAFGFIHMDPNAEMASLGVVILAGTGAVLGIIPGGIIGTKLKFEFK